MKGYQTTMVRKGAGWRRSTSTFLLQSYLKQARELEALAGAGGVIPLTQLQRRAAAC